MLLASLANLPSFLRDFGYKAFRKNFLSLIFFFTIILALKCFWGNEAQIYIQSTFGMWWNGRFAAWTCNWQICSNCMMLSCQHGQESLSKEVSIPLLNLSHEESRVFWGKKRMGQEKWPLSVYCGVIMINNDIWHSAMAHKTEHQ